MSFDLNMAGWPARLRTIQEALRSDWKWAARLAVLAAVFLALLIPIQGRLASVSKALVQKQHEIELAKKAGINFLSAAELQQIQTRASSFESGYILLSQVTAVLDKISEEARRHRLRVIRIHSDSPMPLLDAAGAEIFVKEKKLSRLPIRIRLETNFRALGEFLKGLSATSKQAFVVDELVLSPAAEPGENNLRCDLTLSYFSV
jgi:Tfp pilus assembly protein PilO